MRASAGEETIEERVGPGGWARTRHRSVLTVVPTALTALIAAGTLACEPEVRLFQKLVPSQSELDFGFVRVHDEATRSFELVLTAGFPVEISAIEAQGEWTQHYRFELGGLRVSRAAPLPVTVRFIPSEVGVKDGILRLSADDVGASEPIRIRGEAFSQGILPERSIVRFAPVVVGSEGKEVLRVSNLGSLPVDLTTQPTDAVGPCRLSRFAFCYEAWPERIPAASEGLITLRYRPTASMASKGTGLEEVGLTLRACDEGPGCEARIRLVGQAVEEGLDCAPEVVDFREIREGDCSETRVECRVPGNLSVRYLGATTSGVAFDMPVVRPMRLGPGSRIALPVRFCPSTVGAYAGELTLETQTDGRFGRMQSVPLKGVGTPSSLVVEPGVLDFGELAVGIKQRRRLVLTNAGRWPVEVTRVEIDTEGTTTLSSADAARTTLSPGETQNWWFELRPTEAGLLTTAVRIYVAGAASIEVPVLALGLDLPPCDFTAPANVEFGAVLRGQTSLRTVFLENRGSTDCIVGQIRLEDSSGAFRVVEQPDPGRLGPGRWPIRIAFTPTRQVSYGARVQLDVSHPRLPVIDMHLDGSGTDDALLLGPQNIDLGSRPLGCGSGPQVIRLWNVGSEDVRVRAVDWSSSAPLDIELSRGSELYPVTIQPGGKFEVTVSDPALIAGRDAGALRVEVERDGQVIEQIIDVSRHADVGLVPEERLTQKPQAKADILLVVDHSVSMAQELADWREAIPAWVAAVRNGASAYHFGVTTTDIQQEAGRLLSVDGGAKGPVINASSVPSPDAALVELLQSRTLTPDEPSAFRGLAVLDRFFSGPRLYADNLGLLRDESHLAVVIAAQHEDHSRGEVERYSDRIRGYKGAWNRQDLSVHVIAGDPMNGCTGPAGSASPAPRYARLADAFAGEVMSICTADWDADLVALAGPVVGQRRRFRLAQEPGNPNGVLVWVDHRQVPATEPGGGVNWSFNAADRTVDFVPSRAPAPGDDIRIQYPARCR